MENASKALIIAGAILVSILLISIGVIIINSTGNMTDQVGTTTDTMAIETFNSQFTNYEGRVSASQVKALVSKVNASNAANGTERQVTLTWNGGLTAATLKSTEKYTVSLNYDTTTGYVNGVTVSK